jgi:hypothetical protein
MFQLFVYTVIIVKERFGTIHKEQISCVAPRWTGASKKNEDKKFNFF